MVLSNPNPSNRHLVPDVEPVAEVEQLHDDDLPLTDTDDEAVIAAPATDEDRLSRRCRQQRRAPEPLAGRESSALRVHRVKSTVGTRRRRRWDNFRGLQEVAHRLGTVVEEVVPIMDENQSCFARLFNDAAALEAWTEFTAATTAEQEATLQALRPVGKKPCSLHEEYSADASVEERWARIDRTARLRLRKSHIPQGAVSSMEERLVLTFLDQPTTILVTRLPDSFARLLMHCLAKYHGLESESNTVNGARLTTVRHPCPEKGFFKPSMSLCELIAAA